MYSVEWEGHTIGWEIHIDKKFAYLTSHVDLYIDGELVAKSPGGFRFTDKACSELEHKGKTVPVKLTVVPLVSSILTKLKVDGKLIKRIRIPYDEIKFARLSVILSLVFGMVLGWVIAEIVLFFFL